MSNLVKAEQHLPTPYEPNNMEDAWRFAKIAAASQLTGAKTPEQAFMVMAIGNQYGLSVPQALQRLQPIRGKITPSADTLVGIVLGLEVCEYFEEVETTESHSTWCTKRRGRPEKRLTFTMDEAKRAGLLKGDSAWSTWPKRMLAARAKAFLARDVYPDVFAGVYVQEEIQDGSFANREPVHVVAQVEQVEQVEPSQPVTLTEEGEVVDPALTVPAPSIAFVETVPAPAKEEEEPIVDQLRKAKTQAQVDTLLTMAVSQGMMRADAIALRKEMQAKFKKEQGT